MANPNLHELIIALGIPTYRVTIFTSIPTTPSQQITIAKTLPEQIGRIYGLSIYTDSVTPDNNPLITSTNSTELYLTFKIGNVSFFEKVRLDEMLFNNIATTPVRDSNFMPVNIPSNISLDQSFYENPTLIASVDTTIQIALNLWYITTESYANLERYGCVGINGMPPQVVQQLIQENLAKKEA